jgi:hypothetical protein
MQVYTTHSAHGANNAYGTHARAARAARTVQLKVAAGGAGGCRGSAPGSALPVPASGALHEVLLLFGEDAEECVVGELLPVILRQPAHVLKLVKRPVGRAVLGVAYWHWGRPPRLG